MNPAHLHLLLNHIPAFGLGIGLLALLAGFWRKSRDVQILSLLMLIIASVLTLPAYFSGESAEDVAEAYARNHDAIENHEHAAKPALVAVGVSGLLALILLVYARKPDTGLPRFLVLALVLSSLASMATIVNTAHLGGLISHPEIQGTPAPLPDGDDD